MEAPIDPQQLRDIINNTNTKSSDNAALDELPSKLYNMSLVDLLDGLGNAMLKYEQCNERYDAAIHKMHEDAARILEVATSYMAGLAGSVKEGVEWAVGKAIVVLVKQKWMLERGVEEVEAQGSRR